jgi:hypothetical protein
VVLKKSHSVAAKMIRDALGIENDDFCFPKSWPDDREVRAAVISDWLQTEVRLLV